jgi:uncharacterized membrane protein
LYGLGYNQTEVFVNSISLGFLVLYTLLTVYSLLTIFFRWNYPPFLTPINTLGGFLFSLFNGASRLGWKRILLLLVSCFVISLSMESMGVATGWIYGPYHYTDLLGTKFLGLVPYLIPAAWFMMMYPSLVISARILKSSNPHGWMILPVAAVGGIIMTAWDLVLDPIMVQGGHWIWDGPLSSRLYFGIPLQNFAGWWLTTFLTYCVYLFLVNKLVRTNIQDLSERTPVIMYIITGSSSILSAFIMGLGGPALVGIFAMLPWMILGMRKTEVSNIHGLKTTWF